MSPGVTTRPAALFDTALPVLNSDYSVNLWWGTTFKAHVVLLSARVNGYAVRAGVTLNLDFLAPYISQDSYFIDIYDDS